LEEAFASGLALVEELPFLENLVWLEGPELEELAKPLEMADVQVNQIYSITISTSSAVMVLILCSSA